MNRKGGIELSVSSRKKETPNSRRVEILLLDRSMFKEAVDILARKLDEQKAENARLWLVVEQCYSTLKAALAARGGK